MRYRLEMLLTVLMVLAACGHPKTATKPAVVMVVAKKAVQQGWVMDKGSVIDIKATSSMMSFDYKMKNYAAVDTMIFTQEYPDAPIVLSNQAVLKLPVKKFENVNSTFVDIFRKSVRSEQYPNFILKVDDLSAVPQSGQIGQQVTSHIELTVAGKTRSFTVALKASRNANSLRMVGIQKCKFSDFGLQPPTKVFGIVDVDDELSINIDLKLMMIAL